MSSSIFWPPFSLNCFKRFLEFTLIPRDIFGRTFDTFWRIASIFLQMCFDDFLGLIFQISTQNIIAGIMIEQVFRSSNIPCNENQISWKKHSQIFHPVKTTYPHLQGTWLLVPEWSTYWSDASVTMRFASSKNKYTLNFTTAHYSITRPLGWGFSWTFLGVFPV